MKNIQDIQNLLARNSGLVSGRTWIVLFPINQDLSNIEGVKELEHLMAEAGITIQQKI